MSISPNNPFEKDSSTNSDHPPEQNPKKSNKGCLIAVLVVILLAVLVCCGGGFAVYYVGVGEWSNQVRITVEDNPVITEHIGDVESLEFNLLATAEAGQEAEQSGDSTPIVFEISGSKGEGQLLLMPNTTGGSEFSSGTLVLSDGSRLPIAFDNGTDDLDLDMDFDVGDLVEEGDVESESIETETDADPTDGTGNQAVENPAE